MGAIQNSNIFSCFVPKVIFDTHTNYMDDMNISKKNKNEIWEEYFQVD